MRQFEYKTIQFDPRFLTESELNKMGREGWDLVATFPSILFSRAIGDRAMTREGAVPLLMTVNEACTELRVGRSKMYELMNSGRIKVVRFGRSIRVRRSEVEQILFE